jgi:hypothetical protein
MDRLSDLIKFRDLLNGSFSQLLNEDHVDFRLNTLQQLSTNSVSMSEQINELTIKYQEYANQYQTIIDAYQQIIDITNLSIEKLGQDMITATPLLSNEELTKLLSHGVDSISAVSNGEISQIYEYSNMIFPGLMVGPISTDYIKLMVASDPLYLLGSSVTSLESKISEFPKEYQNRLRLYHNIERLPKHQFSLIFVTKFFHSIPYVQVIDYLKIMLQLLRPGGSVLFTYYNCDIYEVVKLAEEGHIPYASQHRLKKDCQELGYEILEFNNESVDAVESKFISWAQLKRPGKLTTIKQAQVLGSIHQK